MEWQRDPCACAYNLSYAGDDEVVMVKDPCACDFSPSVSKFGLCKFSLVSCFDGGGEHGTGGGGVFWRWWLYGWDDN